MDEEYFLPWYVSLGNLFTKFLDKILVLSSKAMTSILLEILEKITQ